MRASDKAIWFRVKRYGYGVGLPVAWQGWLVLALHLAAIMLSGMIFSGAGALAAAVVLTPAVLWLAHEHSDAPWRWRDGS